MDSVKEKLVELIAKAKRSMRGKSGLSCELARNMYLAESLIANGVTVQDGKDNNVPTKWISVKDRLPSVGCDVLFVCESKSYGVGAYSDTYRDFFSGQFPVKNVTHWCELPQPPKGE